MPNHLQLPQITPNKQNYWGQLHGCALSLAISTLCQAHKGISLIVTPDNLSARQLQDELEYFLHDEVNPIPILEFADWETLPYDNFSPHQDIISQRLLTLSQLQSLKQGIVITAMHSLMVQLPPLEFVQLHTLVLSQGDTVDTDHFRSTLQQAGYHFTSKVLEHGECAIRGSIIDIYPMGSQLPYRIDLFDDDIDSIRTFDPETQRSIEKVTQIKLLPAREFPLTEKNITHFRQTWRAQFSGNPSNCPIYNDITEKIIPAGIEYYLPLFYDKTASLLDYLSSNAFVITIGDLHSAAEKFWKEIKLRYEQRSYDITKPILKPQDMFIPVDMIYAGFKQFTHINIEQINESAYQFKTCQAAELSINRKATLPLEKLQHYLELNNNKRILICAETAGRREVLIELLQSIAIHPTIYHSWQEFLNDTQAIGITFGPLMSGSEIPELNLIIIVEAQLFGEPVLQQRRRVSKTIDTTGLVRDLTELRVGAPVVHLEHGIGRYLGLRHLDTNGQINEFLTLEYAEGAKIYVPVTSLHLISRYSGGDEQVALHRLGSDQWQKEKRKATEKITDVAVELLDIYAVREARKGFSYNAPDAQYFNFASSFPFEETPDQLQAIDQIIIDMQSQRPMDRLICGDVGFGKTEVAMRAAFLGIQNNKQVCVLVPTTLLAQQHFENFNDRFADFPINIDLLSRFRTSKETSHVLQKIETGSVDIIIGTHKLLTNKIKFHNLGLLIIDEEHRFGVKQKEFIKSLRHEIDILSLTATPIPRTLNMSLSGLRDISIIATPPAKRLAIKTFWQEKNTATIREALLREIMRGGQVFYLHNNVETIQGAASELQKLVPEASIEIAHGQMRERQLEKIMSDFYHHRFNVLMCTTIIETGIDIPTANTIIIERADKFGLAQLHQLRGRVGRSHHQAYAYLLTPNRKSLTADAIKRLEAITSIEDLGAGFSLASHDLEIRGAGELLGAEQSGNMHAIGFTLYMELLERAVNALKSGKKPELNAPLQQGPEIDLKISVIIPEDFIPDVHSRLILYKRIASAATDDQLRELQVEMIDRFGLLPTPVKHLFRITELKIMAQQLGILKIKAGSEGGKIEFEQNPPINPAVIIKLIQVHSKVYKLEGPTSLRFILPSETAEQRIDAVMRVLQELK